MTRASSFVLFFFLWGILAFHFATCVRFPILYRVCSFVCIKAHRSIASSRRMKSYHYRVLMKWLPRTPHASRAGWFSVSIFRFYLWCVLANWFDFLLQNRTPLAHSVGRGNSLRNKRNSLEPPKNEPWFLPFGLCRKCVCVFTPLLGEWWVCKKVAITDPDWKRKGKYTFILTNKLEHSIDRRKDDFTKVVICVYL